MKSETICNEKYEAAIKTVNLYIKTHCFLKSTHTTHLYRPSDQVFHFPNFSSLKLTTTTTRLDYKVTGFPSINLVTKFKLLHAFVLLMSILVLYTTLFKASALYLNNNKDLSRSYNHSKSTEWEIMNLINH